MGWGRTLLLGDVGNRLDIADLERDVALLRDKNEKSFSKDQSQDALISQLISENSQLKLYVVSILRLLVAKGTVSEAELKAIVAAVDREDGSADGHFAGKLP